MEPFVLMMIGGGAVMVIFGLFTIGNFVLMGKKMNSNFHTSRDPMKSMFAGMGWHFVLGGIASLGGLCLIGGFLWFLVETFARHGG